MRPVGLCGELVDDRGVDGVLALLRALDCAIFPAPLAEEIALDALAVRAAPAAAVGDQRGAAPLAGFRPPIQGTSDTLWRESRLS